jgi:hypothetical protein
MNQTETRNFTVRRANVAAHLAHTEQITAERPIDAARTFAELHPVVPGARIEVQQNGHRSHRAYVVQGDGTIKNA